ncbi:hypothetical protein ABEW49_24655 [Bacillus anthracis]|uniref:hypothetical protein n=1 Tax=Bacillus anthracis TaxID=1392 RepID=UPI003D1AE87B
MKLNVGQNKYIDTLYYFSRKSPKNLAKTLNIYSKFLTETYQKTLFSTALALSEKYSQKCMGSLPTGLDSHSFLECVSEIKEVNLNLYSLKSISSEELRLWELFFYKSLKNKEKIYKNLLGQEIQFYIVMSEYVPSPPQGQMVRVDSIDGVVQITMVIGYVPFDKKDGLQYSLDESWIQRGTEIGILKYLLSYEKMLDVIEELELEKINGNCLSSIYSSLLWYIQIKIFANLDEQDSNLKSALSNGLFLMKIINQIDQGNKIACNIGDVFKYLSNLLRNLDEYLKTERATF